MSQLNAAPALLQSREERVVRPDFSILIEVPKLRDRGNLRSSARTNPRLRFETQSISNRHSRPRRNVRRRLKREVKIAACALLLSLPLIYGASSAWSLRLGNIAATELTRATNSADEKEGSGLGSALTRQISRSVFEPGVVLLSIEPAQAGKKSEAESPVVFPGYLLPEDSFEEMANEGS